VIMVTSGTHLRTLDRYINRKLTNVLLSLSLRTVSVASRRGLASRR
jgi:hypothetical protein